MGLKSLDRRRLVMLATAPAALSASVPALLSGQAGWTILGLPTDFWGGLVMGAAIGLQITAIALLARRRGRD
jgi:hypothetical protein